MISTVLVRVELVDNKLPLVYAKGKHQPRHQEIPMPVFKKIKRMGATAAYFRAFWDDIMDRWDIAGVASNQEQGW